MCRQANCATTKEDEKDLEKKWTRIVSCSGKEFYFSVCLLVTIHNCYILLFIHFMNP